MARFLCVLLAVGLVSGALADQVQITTVNGTVFVNAEDFVLKTFANTNISLTDLVREVEFHASQNQAAHAALNASISTVSGALGSNIESARLLLSGATFNEQSRAITTEQSLSLALLTRTTSLSEALGVEASRAQLTEASLSQWIDISNSASISRDNFIQTNFTTALSTATVRTTLANEALSTAVVTERNRAIGAEASIGVVADTVVAERTRASLAENALNVSLRLEVSRATAQEQSIAASVNAEMLRALAAEASIGVVADSVVAERVRASLAENALNVSIRLEVSRATAQEQSIAASVNAEMLRALAAEASIGVVNTALNTETSRAVGVENAISGTAAALSTRLSTVGTALSTAIVNEAARTQLALQGLTSDLSATSNQVAVQVSCARQGLVMQADNVTCGLVGSTLPIATTNVFNLAVNMAQCTGLFTTVAPNSVTLCRRANTASGGCVSFWFNPGRIYSQVTGYLTLYQAGTPDGFLHGDMVSIWAGNTPVYAYVVGYTRSLASNGNCPSGNGAGPTSPWSTTGNWNCGSGYTAGTGAPDMNTVYTAVPLFGTGASFTITVPQTSANIEVRVCTDQANSDENILLGASSISVVSMPTLTTAWRNVLSLTSDATQCAQGSWVAQAIGGMTLCRRVNNGVSSCGSIWVTPNAPYSQVTGSVTLYQYYTADAFGGTQVGGDAVTIWAGSTLLWDYAVGVTCPAAGGALPPAVTNGQWSCATGSTSSIITGSGFLYSQVLFGPSAAFTVPLAAPTQATIEIRICLDQPFSDEDIFLSAASISVR